MKINKKRSLFAGLVALGVVVVIAAQGALASTPSEPPESTVDSTTPGDGSMVISPTPGTSHTGSYPPGFDVVVGRIESSGAPDAVKERIISRIETMTSAPLASPTNLGALGALLGRTISESPLRDQVREQLRLRIQEFDRLMSLDDPTGARAEFRQIIDRYRTELMALVQERVHTRLDGLVARLPEIGTAIDTEAWRTRIEQLKERILAATTIDELRDVIVDTRAAISELRDDISNGPES